MKSLRGVFLYISALSILLFPSGCSVTDAGENSENAKVFTPSRLDNFKDWGIYRGDKKGTQYSELDQINAENVHQLEKVWEYQYEGKAEGPGIYSNSIVIDGVLYYNTPRMKTVALNAATGEEIWIFDPAPYNDGKVVRSRSRGLVYWEDEEGNNKRIFNSVRDRVYAIDAKTGKLIEPFGQEKDSKFIDLRKNLPVPPEQADIEITTQGVVYKNFLILPGRQPEGNSGTPGDIRAYNCLTGEFEWIFNTIPLPGQPGYETWEWEEDMIYGAANPWGGLTVDEKRGWVFAATGSAAGEFIYGGSRKGENLYANCVLALDATTGEKKWHYQLIRHDIWDYDLPPAPMLVTTTDANGTTRDVVVQMGKLPLMFILDRDTGEPVFPVVDMPVPSFKGVPGEEPHPTQPWPLKPPPLVRTAMYESDITDITPESKANVLAQFKKHRTGPVYTPASIEGTITTPGHHGSVEWAGGSYDPATNILYVAVNEEPTVHTLVPIEPDNATKNLTAVQAGLKIYNSNCVQCHGQNRAGNPPFPKLKGLTKTDAQIRQILEEGFGGMPSFANLTDEETNNIIAYLRSDEDEKDIFTTVAQDSSRVPTWSGTGSGGTWKTTTPQYINKVHHFVDHMGFPAIKPPWGQLIAVNILEGEILWKVPLGEYPELVKMGIRNTGTEIFGGPVVTAGNIIFMAGTADEKIRAFSKHDGAQLWEYKLPAGGYTTPSVFMIDGKQYVVMAAGGAGKIGTPPGKSLVAFALPDKK